MDKIAKAVSELVESALEINATEMLVQIASTILLFLIIKVFFWEKITNFLEERSELMEREINEATLANQEAQVFKETAENELKEVRLNAKSIVDDAKSRGEKERNDIVSNAKQEAKNVMESAKKEIDSEIEKAREGINEEIVSVAVLMAEKVISKEIDSEKHKELLDEISRGVAN